MAEPIDPTTGRFRGIPITLCLGFVLGLLAQFICYASLGTTLGFYFAGIIATALLVPAMSLAERSVVHRLLIAGAVADGIGIVGMLGIVRSISFADWALWYVLILCWSFAMAGLAHGLEWVSRNGIVAAAIVVVLAILWLGWPIWFNRLNVGWMVSAHPLFAVNAVMPQLGVWPERPIAYQYLMRLGQDIPYGLPSSILPAGAGHLLVGAFGLLIGRVVRKS